MIIKIRDKSVAIVTGDVEKDKAVATFLTVALRYAARHAQELELSNAAQEYLDLANQFYKYAG